ncbi:MAG TPA: ribosome small subunit-dependent GTPase A [Thermoanaerobaculia bacterium]|nr:ribosome small subunit-dependent GTPase A [Thermoanaerobaculia bacterium]
MERYIRRALASLEHHKNYEIVKARRKAAKLNRTVVKGKSRNKAKIDPRDLELFEDEPDLDLDDPRGSAPKDLGLADEAPGKGEQVEGLVVGLYPRGCEAFVAGELLECDLSPAVRLDDENDLAVGDRVTIRKEAARNVVTDIAARATVLSRPDPLVKDRERVIAANVDVVVHVASVIAPPLRPGLIDRYLIAIQSGGAQPLIAVNKVDLVPAEDRELILSELDPYRALGIPIVLCSSESREGLEELRQRLLGRLAVFVGHSGVGKSSLIKALKPEITVRVGKIRARTGTGRHTTTRSTLYDLGGETRIIDTPGIREFGLWQVDPRELRYYFPEIQDRALECRFNDCLHDQEPECAVKAAVEKGEIPSERYANYLKMLAELTEEQEK